MFSTSLGLLVAHLGLYVLLPLIPGVITMRIISADRVRERLFYILSWFLGVWILGYGLFLLQFIRFGIDRLAYGILLVFLLVVLFIRLKLTNTSRKSLSKTLPLSFKRMIPKHASTWYHISTWLLIVYIVLFVAAGFYFVTQFPSYADDAFGNWHLPVINILYDGGVQIFGEVGQILGRGRLGYPVMIPTMQAFISNVIGGYNDIYINIFPWLSFVFFIKAISLYIYQKRQDIRLALIAPALIISLPLIFLHTTQGYMDLLSAIYTALAIMSLYEWLNDDGHAAHLVLWIAFLSILSYVKNDGFVVYMLWTLIALIIYFVIHRKHELSKLRVFKKTSTWVFIVALVLFFIAPFTFLKSYYNLGFNQAAGADAGLGLASTIHREIFPAIWKTMRSMNNFSVAPLILLVTLIISLIYRKRIAKEKSFLLIAPAVILAIFIAVFLFTENYKFVLDQTTSNRVFTMVLVIFLALMPLVYSIDKSWE